MENFKPQNPGQACEFITWAASHKTPLRLCGNGTKAQIGRPVKAAHTLYMSGLSGIVLYEPEELVMSARAGTPLREIKAELAKNNQMLAFDPPDLGPLFGHEAGGASIGGVFSCNLSGPGRIRAGAARDHLLGFEAVNGLGEAIKSGGRVMKNVTGYDLSKLVCGAYGTLAALTTLTFKVLPAPRFSLSLVLDGLSARAGVELMTGAFGEAFELSAAAHLPRPVAARARLPAIAETAQSATLFRIEGVRPSVESRAAQLRKYLAPHGKPRQIEQDESQALWQQIRDVQLFEDRQEHALWRLNVPPASGAEVLARISAELENEVFLDQSGALIWLLVPRMDADAARLIRAAFAPCGGCATLMRAADPVRLSLPVFQPRPAPLHRLAGQVKAAFDPLNILNPGLLYGDETDGEDTA